MGAADDAEFTLCCLCAVAVTTWSKLEKSADVGKVKLSVSAKFCFAGGPDSSGEIEVG